MAKAAVKRGKNKDNARRSKKKTSILTQERVEYVDYKDVNLLALKLLRPGGLLVLDCFNPDPAYASDDGRVIVQRSVIEQETGQAALLLLSRSTDWGSQLQEITYLIDRPDQNGLVRRAALQTSFRFIFRNELQLLLKLGGFDLKEVFGSYALEPLEANSDKLIGVATLA